MNRIKLVTVVGARPQFIKLASVSRALKDAGSFDDIVVHTGQHYDDNMSQIFFEELELGKPKYNLAVGSGTHGFQTGQMLIGIESILLKEAPDCVVTYGDTNSTLAGALAASKLKIPIAHVESGLRSYNRTMPEEINRVVTDHLSDLLYTPTPTASDILLKEGIPAHKIVESGDVMYDAALFFRNKAARESDIVARLSIQPKQYILVTLHRAENVDDEQRLRTLFDALGVIAERMPVIFPAHPRTHARLKGAAFSSKNINLISPVGYLDMAALESNAAVIATDSGGVQKEAYFHRVPCVTLRGETEWTELLESKWTVLAPPESTSSVADAVTSRIGQQGDDVKLYGDGAASIKIAESLAHHLS